MPRTIRQNIIALITGILCLYSCDNLDCPLLNTVYTTYGFYDVKSGQRITLSDTLTVSPANSDTILINQITGVNSIDLPMSFAGQSDTLLFRFCTSKNEIYTDTIIIAHTNEPHFESIDCSPAIFHTITGSELKKMTTGSGTSIINHITTENTAVNYDPKEHFKVYISK